MTGLKLLTFDVTGTLLAFRTPVMDQYATVAAFYGIKADPGVLQQNFKKGWKILSAEHPNFGLHSGIGWQSWWRKIVLHSFKDTRIDDDTLSKVSDSLLTHFETEKAWKLVEGGLKLLETLKKQQLKLGIISNFDPRLHTILKNLKIDDYFEFVLTSYEFGHAKPDQRIFLDALRRGAVEKPSMAAHVGNDAVLDFQAAASVGFHSVLVDDSQEEQLPNIVADISKVEKSIEFFNQTM